MKNSLLFVALGMLFLVTLAYAEESDVSLGKIIVTPARYAQAAALAPSYVKVVTAQDIATSGAMTLPGLLSQKAGVHVYSKGSDKNTMVDIGGYNDAAVSNVLVLLNGRRLNPSDSSGPDLAGVPLDSIERIEVIRGGSSVLYGDNAVGGVVNIITHQGRPGVSGDVSVEAGSYGRRKETAQVTSGNKAVTVYVFGGYQETNGYRANNQYQAGDGQVRINGKGAPLLSLGLEAGWHDDHYGLPSGLRGMAQVMSLGRRGTRTPEDYGDTRDRY
ncbi:MAG: TonB-dependent receptor, partial [Candidatus Omnitrophica bacterium]|nr:TonB-dependent receptor [Candidatus Omnitrophota bacterium]